MGKFTVAWTNGALAAVGSTPEVVSVKFTLPVGMLAVMMDCAKFTLNSVLPKKLLLAWPFTSVIVVAPDNSEPAPDVIVHVTVTPAWGCPWTFFTTTTMGTCAAKFWAAICPSPERTDMV